MKLVFRSSVLHRLNWSFSLHGLVALPSCNPAGRVCLLCAWNISLSAPEGGCPNFGSCVLLRIANKNKTCIGITFSVLNYLIIQVHSVLVCVTSFLRSAKYIWRERMKWKVHREREEKKIQNQIKKIWWEINMEILMNPMEIFPSSCTCSPKVPYRTQQESATGQCSVWNESSPFPYALFPSDNINVPSISKSFKRPLSLMFLY
jgi:hypothetical protein